MNFDKLEYEASVCTLCDLYLGRNIPVFSRGQSNADVLICGMCPGPAENKAGIPFIGAAGKLLDNIIREAFTDKPGFGIHITNLVKCFVTPGVSLKDEWMYSCLPYFLVQLEIIKPKVVIALGKDVCNFMLNINSNMGSMRGNVYDYLYNTKLISSYHPSYLIRGGGIKHMHYNKVVDDFKIALSYIDAK